MLVMDEKEVKRSQIGYLPMQESFHPVCQTTFISDPHYDSTDFTRESLRVLTKIHPNLKIFPDCWGIYVKVVRIDSRKPEISTKDMSAKKLLKLLLPRNAEIYLDGMENHFLWMSDRYFCCRIKEGSPGIRYVFSQRPYLIMYTESIRESRIIASKLLTSI